MKTLIPLFLYFFISSISAAQNTDSLENQLSTKITKANKEKILISLCKTYRNSNPNAMRLYAEELITLSQTDTLSNSYAWGQYYLGDYFYLVGDFSKTEKHLLAALEAFQKNKNQLGEQETSASLANIYFFRDQFKTSLNFAEASLDAAYSLENKAHQANILALLCDIYTYMERYNLAIQHCIQSLKLKEELQLTQGKEITLNSIGLIYQEMGTYEKSKEYLFDALELAKKNGKPYNIATTHSNIGNFYLAIGEIDSALISFRNAMKIDSAANDKTGLAYSFFDIGKIYQSKNQYIDAKLYFEKAEILAKEQKMPELQARIGLETGDILMNTGRYQKAVTELKNSSTLAQKINSSSILKDTYQKLSRLYDKMEDKDNALIYMKLFMLESERKFKKDNIRSIAEIEALYNIEKKEKEIGLLQKDNNIKELQAEQRTFFIIALSVGLLLLIILIIILNNRNKLKTRTNQALNQQNIAIQEQKEEIESQKEELRAKGNSLADKNQQITDSIIYAKQIQDSLLPQNSTVKEIFPDSFIFIKPKDIISGDFYWFTKIENKIAIALVDCTGHGVPGAFMTVLANSLLNQIVIETGITSPDLIVSLLDQKIQQNLHQTQLENTNTDGLDIGLVMLDPESKTLEFTGAKIPLYISQNHEINVISPDRFTVGSTQQENKVFLKRELKYQAGDVIYLSSDGFQDQFGGPGNKKFMKKNFRNLLQDIVDKDISEQMSQIEETFVQWRGSNPQTDDILIIGFKLS